LAIWANARIALGLSEQEFWRLTPAKLTAMVDVVNDLTKLEDYRADVIVTVIRRIVGDKKAQMWDFFPQHKTKREPKVVTADEVRANMKAFIEMQKLQGAK